VVRQVDQKDSGESLVGFEIPGKGIESWSPARGVQAIGTVETGDGSIASILSLPFELSKVRKPRSCID
jgi:hypothetical protein